MSDFVALYRGRTVSDAELVAVSAEPRLVRKFFAELLGEHENRQAAYSELFGDSYVDMFTYDKVDMFPYDKDALIERGELIPRSLVVGYELGEPLPDRSE